MFIFILQLLIIIFININLSSLLKSLYFDRRVTLGYYNGYATEPVIYED